MSRGWVERMEFYLVAAGVFLATFTAIRHPALSFNASDLFFTVALAIRLSRGIIIKPFGAATSLWMLGLVLMLGGLMIGSVVRGDPIRGFIVFAQYVFAYFLLPQLILSRAYPQTILLMKIAVFGLAANAFLGVAAYFIGYSAGYSRHFVFVTGGGRVAGLVDNPNGLASLIALTLPIVWFLILQRHFRPVVAGSLVALFFVTVIMTSSNSGLFLATIGSVIFLVGLGNTRLVTYFAILVLAVSVVIAQWGEAFLPATFQERVLTSIQSGDVTEAGTFEDRYDLMVEAWENLSDNLIIGMGADQYENYSSSTIKVHNVYLLLANEGGIVSLVGFVLLVLALILVGSNARGIPHPHLTMVCLLSTLVVFIGFGMVSTHLYSRALVIPLLLVAALALFPAAIRPDGGARGALRRPVSGRPGVRAKGPSGLPG